MFFKPESCNFFLKLLFLINLSICFSIFFESSFFKTIASFVVSVKPPLLEIIVAHPREEDSRAVLPNGSSHLDGITAISDS